MHRLFCLCTSVLLALPVLAQSTTSSVHQFAYHPDRTPVGTMYHYTKSNLDNTNTTHLYIYLASPEDIQVLKVEANGGRAYVEAQMNWNTFAATSLVSWKLAPDGSRQPQARILWERDAPKVVGHLGPMQMPLTYSHIPSHLYNFDFTSLNVTLPHLKEPTESFTVGVVDPNWTLFNSPDFQPKDVVENGMLDKGRAHFDYQGQDIYRGIICHKYEVAGSGMEDQVGYMWISKAEGHIVKFEHPVPDNPGWVGFKLDLLGTQQHTSQSWESFIASTAQP